MILLPVIGFAQEGKPLKSIAIPRTDTPLPDKKPEDQTEAPQYSISKPFEPKMFKSPKKVYEAPQLENKIGMGNQPKSDLNVSEQYVKKLTKEYNREFSGDVKKENIYFGQIKTKSQFVIILYRDYGDVDFDYIRVEVGETLITKQTMLNGVFKGTHVQLIKGKNSIVFTALNEGEGSPNTAEFKILDENNIVLYHSQWALKKDYKAIIDIIKED